LLVPWYNRKEFLGPNLHTRSLAFTKPSAPSSFNSAYFSLFQSAASPLPLLTYSANSPSHITSHHIFRTFNLTSIRFVLAVLCCQSLLPSLCTWRSPSLTPAACRSFYHHLLQSLPIALAVVLLGPGFGGAWISVSEPPWFDWSSCVFVSSVNGIAMFG
jgi:hypothetical protein